MNAQAKQKNLFGELNVGDQSLAPGSIFVYPPRGPVVVGGIDEFELSESAREILRKHNSISGAPIAEQTLIIFDAFGKGNPQQVPVKKIKKSETIRPLSSEAQLQKAMEQLVQKRSAARGAWSRRAIGYKNVLATGDVVQVAEVLGKILAPHRGSTYAKAASEVSYTERMECFDPGMKLLSEELALVSGVELSTAEAHVQSMLLAPKAKAALPKADGATNSITKLSDDLYERVFGLSVSEAKARTIQVADLKMRLSGAGMKIGDAIAYQMKGLKAPENAEGDLKPLRRKAAPANTAQVVQPEQPSRQPRISDFDLDTFEGRVAASKAGLDISSAAPDPSPLKSASAPKAASRRSDEDPAPSSAPEGKRRIATIKTPAAHDTSGAAIAPSPRRTSKKSQRPHAGKKTSRKFVKKPQPAGASSSRTSAAQQKSGADTSFYSGMTAPKSHRTAINQALYEKFDGFVSDRGIMRGAFGLANAKVDDPKALEFFIRTQLTRIENREEPEAVAKDMGLDMAEAQALHEKVVEILKPEYIGARRKPKFLHLLPSAFNTGKPSDATAGSNAGEAFRAASAKTGTDAKSPSIAEGNEKVYEQEKPNASSKGLLKKAFDLAAKHLDAQTFEAYSRTTLRMNPSRQSIEDAAKDMNLTAEEVIEKRDQAVMALREYFPLTSKGNLYEFMKTSAEQAQNNQPAAKKEKPAQRGEAAQPDPSPNPTGDHPAEQAEGVVTRSGPMSHTSVNGVVFAAVIVSEALAEAGAEFKIAFKKGADGGFVAEISGPDTDAMTGVRILGVLDANEPDTDTQSLEGGLENGM